MKRLLLLLCCTLPLLLLLAGCTNRASEETTTTTLLTTTGGTPTTGGTTTTEGTTPKTVTMTDAGGRTVSLTSDVKGIVTVYGMQYVLALGLGDKVLNGAKTPFDAMLATSCSTGCPAGCLGHRPSQGQAGRLCSWSWTK